MKTLTKTLTLTLIAFSLNTFAQSATEKFQMGMKRGLEMLASAKGTNDFTGTANYFERVAQAEAKALSRCWSLIALSVVARPAIRLL